MLPQRVILERVDLHVLATSADMVYLSRLSQQIFLHLLGRSNSRPDDRVQMGTQVSVACWSKETRDGCDSGLEKAACRCESPSDFAGVVQRVCMRVQELAWAIGGGFARRPFRASGVSCTSYYYDVLLSVRIARLRCHLQVDRWTARDSGGQAVVRVPWVDRKRRVVDGSRQQRDGGCAVVTITAPPLGATGVI